MRLAPRAAASSWLAAAVILFTPAFLLLPHHTAHESGPPPAHTGGFGEPTCQACHSEFQINPSEGALGIDGFPLTYEQRQRYTVSISVLSADMQYAGFQAAIRYADGPNAGSTAGDLSPLDNLVSVHFEPSTGVRYIQHTKAGSRKVVNGVATWSFVWTAPSDTTPVIIHLAANDANGDNSPLGDYVYTHHAEARGATGSAR